MSPRVSLVIVLLRPAVAELVMKGGSFEGSRLLFAPFLGSAFHLSSDVVPIYIYRAIST